MSSTSPVVSGAYLDPSDVCWGGVGVVAVAACRESCPSFSERKVLEQDREKDFRNDFSVRPEGRQGRFKAVSGPLFFFFFYLVHLAKVLYTRPC